MFVCEGETKQQQLAGVHWTHSDGSERQGEFSERRIIFIYYLFYIFLTGNSGCLSCVCKSSANHSYLYVLYFHASKPWYA